MSRDMNHGSKSTIGRGGGGSSSKPEGGGEVDQAATVGSLLADIAVALGDALRVFSLADKSGWGDDEWDQVRELEAALDEAKRDFQEMGPLVKGQFYYESDDNLVSLAELRALRAEFNQHAQTFKAWARAGGPVNPLWARDTVRLRRALHRAQCRAARRIFNTEQEDPGRCLGAFLVYRLLRRRGREEGGRGRRYDGRPQPPPPSSQTASWGLVKGKEVSPWRQGDEEERQQEGQPDLPNLPNHHHPQRADGSATVGSPRRPQLSRQGSLESLVPACNAVGAFQRFGDRDIAFVCDFCDGFIVWEDLRTMPAARSDPPPPSTAGTTSSNLDGAYPHWQAVGKKVSWSDGDEDDEEKTIVFAPLAVANHLPPARGDWRARLTCPFCESYTYVDQGADGDGAEVRYAADERGFPDLRSFQEHLEWHHTAFPVPSLPVVSAVSKCVLM